MKPEAIRIAVALEHGYQWFQSPLNREQKVLARSQTEANTSRLGDWVWSLTPNYPVNLDAMHEAEKHIRGKGTDDWGAWDAYVETLAEKLGSDDVAHATAAERAEAFLRVLGKWVEEDATP